jgi:hypothetical protein
MSYSTDPIFDAQRFTAAAAASAAEHEAQMERHEGDFIGAVRKLDANALAPWAPMVRDFSFTQGPTEAKRVERKRYPTVAEVMRESIDFGGPSDSEIMQFLANVAYGTDLATAPRTARILIGQMAHTYATNNTGL